jgi:phosphoglycerol transferase MdoB-like AlkP superfamily enzyme
MNMNDTLRRILKSRYGLLLPFTLIHLALATVLRTALLVRSIGEMDAGPAALAGIYLSGAVYDLASAAYFAVPFVLYLAVLPDRAFNSRPHRYASIAVFFATVCLLVFSAFAEWTFWDEFQARFNFIAVDYLVYTQEVTRNIAESYPMPLLLGAIFAVASALVAVPARAGWLAAPFAGQSTLRSRGKVSLALLLMPALFGALLGQDTLGQSANRYATELSKNGIHSIFAAFRANSLDYDTFYATEPDAQAFRRLREMLAGGGSFESAAPLTNITHRVTSPAHAERHYNVVFVVVESLSAEYLGAFGNGRGLTPNLDRLADEGMLFTNLYATGTRTVRGLEALVLSVPPTPGGSIVKRPGSSGLFSAGSLFNAHGYDTKFLYGGHAYFDNMAAFFGGNGFTVVDRTDIPSGEITFTNAWGVADEDIFTRSLAEADASHEGGNPFMQLIMTTSNHRPFTYPEGRIDIPSHTGRDGAVKYTDYAIGEFVRRARAHPWFNETIFVVVADHCSGSAGKTDLSVPEYHIPLIVYAPGIVKPARVETLASQIDVVPTLTAMMGWEYESQFFGADILAMDPAEGRAFIGNYQHLGLLRGDRLAVLSPRHEVRIFTVDRQAAHAPATVDERHLVEDAIAYYQSASHLFRMLMKQHAEAGQSGRSQA